jgi:hypothetical protein
LISRREGYLRSEGLEETGLRCAELFFREVLGTSVERILEAGDNYRTGDLRAPSGVTIECKGQGIDPDRYPQNFVEVFEVTTNPLHDGGFDKLATLLGMDAQLLERVQVRIKGRGTPSPLGHPDRISISIQAIASGALTIYVNNRDCSHVYIYRDEELRQLIVAAMADGLARGAGNSNEDLHSPCSCLLPRGVGVVKRPGTGTGVATELSRINLRSYAVSSLSRERVLKERYASLIFLSLRTCLDPRHSQRTQGSKGTVD